MLVFGAAMVVIMVLRPRGLVSSRTPSVALGRKRATSRPRWWARAADDARPSWKSPDLTMRFGGLMAVDRVSFAARRGDITAVIGPNGAGKTTVFNCITGFYRPSEGSIRLHRPTPRRRRRWNCSDCPATASPAPASRAPSRTSGCSPA